MELARKAFEAMYDKKATIVEYQEKKVNYVTKNQEVTVLENQPCRLSFSNIAEASQTDTKTNVVQTIKLFLSPDVTIKPGSKIIIDGNAYCRSGKPAVYGTHQEVILGEFRGWA